MAISVTNDFVFGQKTATAGTAAKLDAAEYALKSLAMAAHSTNSGKVFYGGSDVASTTQKGLGPGSKISIGTTDGRTFLLSSIYIDVAVTGDGVDFIGERA